MLLAITAYPIVANVWNSFHFDNLSFGALPHRFVGVDNYGKMFSSAAVAGRAGADARRSPW